MQVNDIITTNGLNVFKILGINEVEICIKDILTDDFSIFKLTEHKFKPFNPKDALKSCLLEIISETDINNVDANYLIEGMNIRIDKFII